MTTEQAKIFAYIQKQYEIQVKLYAHFLESGQYSSQYHQGFIDGHFNGSILQLELMAESNKLFDLAAELKALYHS